MFGVTLTALVVALLVTFFRHGARRAFGIGFVTCGSIYLSLTAFSSAVYYSHENYESTENPLVTDALVTSQLSHRLYVALFEHIEHGHGSGGIAYTQPYPTDESSPSFVDFMNVSHALWTLLLAGCGGWLAMWLHFLGEKERNADEDIGANAVNRKSR